MNDWFDDSHADRPFLIDSVHGRTYSYSMFRGRAQALADELERQGLRTGERLAIVLPNCPEFAALYYACFVLGAVATPISTSLHADEVALLLGSCGASMVACSSETLALIPGSTLSGQRLARFAIAPWAQEDDGNWSLAGDSILSATAPRLVDDGAPLCLTFTSGTTGLPKGILHSRSSIFGSARGFAEAMQYDHQTRLQHLFPMSYMAGFLNSLVCPFVAGGSVVVGRGFTAEHAMCFWDEPSAYGVNTLWLSPTMVAAVLRVNRERRGVDYAKKCLRAVSIGTAPFPRELREQFEDRYGVVTKESYGLSETLFVSTNRPGESERGVGKLLPDVMVEHRAPAESAAMGELFIRSPFLMLGSLDIVTGRIVAPDSDWYPSGDIGHVDARGDVYIDGRAKDLIIRGGLNISPRAVEEVLARHSAVDGVAVIGLPHDFYGEEVVAVVRLKPGFSIVNVRPTLVSYCKERLAAQVVPTRFVAVDEFPYSTSGKIQKARLREQVCRS
jgi:long-chain acyl-CoA synthetase